MTDETHMAIGTTPGAESTAARIAGQWHRRKLMLRCPQIPLGLRLRQQMTLHPSPRPFFREQLQRDGDRFRFRNYGVDLVSEPVGGADENAVANGFALVLGEMYALPMLFWGSVTPRPGQVALDLGANIGTTALVIAQAVGSAGRVYAFEPLTHETLRRNFQANGCENTEVVPLAVGAACGEIEMLVDKFAPGSRIAYALGDEHRYDHRARVRISTLDDWRREHGVERVDFIKADIEGAEGEAIQGAEQLIRDCRPAWSISSDHLGPDGVHAHRATARTLRALGYQVKEIGQQYLYAWHDRNA